MFEQKQFNPQLSKTIGPANYKAADYTKGFNERDAWLRQGEAAFLRSLEQNAQIATQNAGLAVRNNVGKGLQDIGKLTSPLAEFSATLKKRDEEAAKQREIDDKVNAEYTALMGGDISVVDGSAQIDQMGRLADQESQVTVDYEQRTGDSVGASYMHQNMGERTGTQAMLSGQMSVRQARGMYPAWLQTYLDSNARVTIGGQETTVQQAIATGDPGAIAQVINGAPAEYLRRTGLYGASGPARAELVNTLAPTIWSTNGQVLQSLQGNAAKATRTQNIQQASGQAFSSAAAGQLPVGQIFREGADLMFRSNTGLTRGEANEKVVGAMLEGYIANGDVDSIDQLNLVQQVPGQRGSELGLLYGQMISDARAKAIKRDNANDSYELKAAKEAMYQELGGVNDPGQRTAILEKYARELENNGQWKAANDLRGTASANAQSGATAVNEQLLMSQLEFGGVTPEMLNDALKEGSISPEGHKKLMKELTPVNYMKNDTYKQVVGSEKSRAEEELLRVLKLKKDKQGEYFAGENSIISPGAAKSIVARMKMDMDKAVSVALSTHGDSLSTEQIQELSTKYAREWIKENLYSEGGKYRINDVTLDTVDGDKALRERFKQLNTVEGLNSAAQYGTTLQQAIAPQDFSSTYKFGNAVSAHLQRNYRPNRGDKLVSKSEAEQLKADFEAGKVPQSLKNTAQGLGVNELKLINDQLKAHGLDPITPDLVSPNASRTTQLIQAGIPGRNAATLMQITDIQDKALDVLGKYESPNHGYDAFNQGGYANGRGAIGSGSYQQRFGRSLTDMSVGEIMSLQAARPGMPQAEWNRQGRLHAVGRYQFTRDTFAEYAQKLGLPPDTKFTPDVQDKMALALMKDRGISPWVGPVDKASAAERSIVSQATQQLRQRQMQTAQRILENPYSTSRQVARTHAMLQNSNTGPQLQATSTVPYVDQRTAINGAGDRQCFSASATMMANAYGINISYDKYNSVRGRYGDTTDSNAQISALRELGLDVSVQDNGSLNEIAQSVSTGKPVAIGIQHNAGSGHWIVVTGVTPNGDFIVHDPFGKLVQSRNGGWAYTNSGSSQPGRNAVYSRDFLYSVFEDRGPGTGRIMRVA